jgi:hypothetical protein
LSSSQELRDAFLAIDTGDGQLDALELQEAARKVAPRHASVPALSAWRGYTQKTGKKWLETSNDGKTHHLQYTKKYLWMTTKE